MKDFETERDTCDCNIIHQDIVDAVRSAMPDDDTLMDVADIFKLFSDSTRVKIMCALMSSEMCVCDISALLGMTKSSVSHQLRILKQADLVRNRKAGRVVYYSLADEHVRTIFASGLEHATEDQLS